MSDRLPGPGKRADRRRHGTERPGKSRRSGSRQSRLADRLARRGKGDTQAARWPYRAFLEGLDTFDDKRGLAPQGVLTFVLQRTAPLPKHATVAIDSATKRDGAREERFTYDKPRAELPLPAHERNWSDETLVTVEPAQG